MLAAMARRFYTEVVAAFFDDTGILKAVECGSAASSVQAVHNVTECDLDTTKSQSLVPQRVCFSQTVVVGRVLTNGTVRSDMRPGLRKKLLDLVDACFDSEQ